MKNKNLISTILTAVVAAVIAVVAYAAFFQPESKIVEVPAEQKMLYANLPSGSSYQPEDFTLAAQKAVNAVVHVKTMATASEEYNYNPFYEFFYGDRAPQPQPRRGFGSGVIISEDGYIITNNHVIDEMDEIEIVLNDRRSFPAEVVGADPNTDIALLKVDAENMDYLTYGSSDDLQLGEWVLAVGNPYNLTSTVTAGIVSAKARNIGIFGGGRAQFPIESFIQTDAAVNPGNSGGALVDTQGRLVGINTAIASQTGAYSGNSFAVPVSIVRKVVADLQEFGVVQRAVLGVEITNVTQELADEHNIDGLKGVYVAGLREDGAAMDAGIETGDIILSVNNVPVNSVSELQEQISRYRPNDEVDVTIKRNGKEKQIEVTLRNLEGNTAMVEKNATMSVLGAEFEAVSDREKRRLNIENGVKVSSLESGKLMKAGIQEGFIITRINNKPVDSPEDVNDVLQSIRGGVYVEGIYPNGVVSYYAFGM